MPAAARALAAYASEVGYDRLPPEVIRRAKACIIDTVGAAVQGVDLPWSRIVINHARRYGGQGPCQVLGAPASLASAPAAALANGVLAHSFELDSLRKPGAGVHPGATILPAILAVAQEEGVGGKAVIAAFVAGCEVMLRVGRATKHSCETRGFHAPGLTGPFGAGTAVGHLLKLDADRMANLLGIAGSLSGGLLEFAKSGTGGMVKRLHLGRAAESGVVAARLAADGFTGPETVLDGPYGFLNAYCAEYDAGLLVPDDSFETMKICFKRYPCHITAHTPIEAVQGLREEHGFAPDDIVAVIVGGAEKMATLHNIPAPSDIIMAQYSIPFCVALALARDARDPASFDDAVVHDPAVTAMCRRVSMRTETRSGASAWACSVEITLRDGRVLSRSVDDFKGTPARPLDDDDLWDKFARLTQPKLGAKARSIFDRLLTLESEEGLGWLGA